MPSAWQIDDDDDDEPTIRVEYENDEVDKIHNCGAPTYARTRLEAEHRTLAREAGYEMTIDSDASDCSKSASRVEVAGLMTRSDSCCFSI